MEVAGIAISVFGLSTALAATVRKIRKTVQDIRYARGDLHEVEKEVLLFARIYDDFLDACDEASSVTENASKIKTSLISWTQKTIKGFENLLAKVQAIARNPEYHYSVSKVATAYYSWIRSKSTVKYLRASLSVARQSMIAFTNIRVIEKLNEELAYLRSTLSPTEREIIELRLKMTVDERVKIIQKKCRNRHSQRRNIEKDLNEAVKELAVQQEKVKDPVSVPRTEPLLQFHGALFIALLSVYCHHADTIYAVFKQPNINT
ncbi:hypothetical protein J4E91_008959 [Alternaria rosae]|nr:hypothetical protein J4E91_008959 [Alternaria rosae]